MHIGNVVLTDDEIRAVCILSIEVRKLKSWPIAKSNIGNPEYWFYDCNLPNSVSHGRAIHKIDPKSISREMIRSRQLTCKFLFSSCSWSNWLCSRTVSSRSRRKRFSLSSPRSRTRRTSSSMTRNRSPNWIASSVFSSMIRCCTSTSFRSWLTSSLAF